MYVLPRAGSPTITITHGAMATLAISGHRAKIWKIPCYFKDFFLYLFYTITMNIEKTYYFSASFHLLLSRLQFHFQTICIANSVGECCQFFLLTAGRLFFSISQFFPLLKHLPLNVTYPLFMSLILPLILFYPKLKTTWIQEFTDYRLPLHTMKSNTMIVIQTNVNKVARYCHIKINITYYHQSPSWTHQRCVLVINVFITQC